MVSLADLTDGTPNEKQWLNIVANTVETDKTYQVSPVTEVSSSPVSFTPANWVNAVIKLLEVQQLLTLPQQVTSKIILVVYLKMVFLL